MVQPVGGNNEKQTLNNGNGYTVKSGDTLSAVAARHGVNLNDLIKANPQIKNPNLIHPGQSIGIPNKRTTGSLAGMPVASSIAPNERPVRMSAGETEGLAARSSASLPSPYGNYQNEILSASRKYNVPPEIITAVMSRETNGRNIIGDGGHGHGLMQIDDRSHAAFLQSHQNGLDPASNIDYGTSIIRDNLNLYNGDYRKALAAYNSGPGNVNRAVANGLNPDAYTTGRNYGSDVLARAQHFKQFFGGANHSAQTAQTSGADRNESPLSSAPGDTSANRPQASSAGYTVRPNDTLSEIAFRHGLSLNSVIAANPQIKNPNLIYPGQKINMPGNGQALQGGGNYSVRSGDTLSGIAARHGVSLNSVIAANPQIKNPNLIYPNQSIRIPGAGRDAGAPEAAEETAERVPSRAPSQSSAPNIEPGRYDGRSPASGTTRTDAWNPVNPPLTNGPGNRSANNYAQTINQFAVGNNPRYAPRNGNTYCNIFVWDVTRAMGAEIPHWFQGRELDANGTVDWMRNHGAGEGWRRSSAAEAQQMANEGLPTVALWKNPGGIGHVAVVRPGEMTNRGAAIAQAGSRNFNSGHVADSFGSRPAEYWVHE